MTGVHRFALGGKIIATLAGNVTDGHNQPVTEVSFRAVHRGVVSRQFCDEHLGKIETDALRRPTPYLSRDLTLLAVEVADGIW
jgi:hypothetical protein